MRLVRRWKSHLQESLLNTSGMYFYWYVSSLLASFCRYIFVDIPTVCFFEKLALKPTFFNSMIRKSSWKIGVQEETKKVGTVNFMKSISLQWSIKNIELWATLTFADTFQGQPVSPHLQGHAMEEEQAAVLLCDLC